MDYTKAVMSLLNKLQNRGCEIVKVHDGENWEKCQGDTKLASRKLATEVVTSVDESFVVVKYNEERANLFIVLGNDESEILADWRCNGELDSIIEEVSSEFYSQWEKV